MLRNSQTSSVTIKAASATVIKNEDLKEPSDEESENKAGTSRIPFGALQDSETPDSRELWTQRDQRLLEIALQQFPKGTADRLVKQSLVSKGKRGKIVTSVPTFLSKKL